MFYREKDQDWETELQSIINQAEKSKCQSDIGFPDKLRVLLSPSFLRPFKCAGVLTILSCASGIYTVTNYTHTFLEVRYAYDEHLFSQCDTS